VLDERTAKSLAIAVTTHRDATPQSAVRPVASLARLTKCSPARLRGWSGQVQASENDWNWPSALISLTIAARVLGFTLSNAI
jgi:hypothetical protein